MNLLSTEKNLQLAVVKKLSELFNNAYRVYCKEDFEENAFKFASILDLDYDSYNQYDIQGDLITDNKGKPIKYYPVQVGELMGDREPNPDVFIADIIIPIAMLIPEEDVKDVLETINIFNQEIIANVYDIDYTLPNSTEKFKLTLLPNMPSFSDFVPSQGSMFKNVEFELVGVLSSGVLYGNQIQYSFAINSDTLDKNSIEWYNIIKVEPTTSRNKDLHIDQQINSTRAKATSKSTSWVKEMSILGKANDVLTKRLVLNADCVLNDTFILKIDYIGFNMSDFADENYNPNTDTYSVIRKVELQELTYSDDIGDFVEINFTLVERF